MRTIRIGNRLMGEGGQLYFIADIAANHDGDLDRALHLIELAKEAVRQDEQSRRTEFEAHRGAAQDS